MTHTGTTEPPISEITVINKSKNCKTAMMATNQNDPFPKWEHFLLQLSHPAEWPRTNRNRAIRLWARWILLIFTLKIPAHFEEMWKGWCVVELKKGRAAVLLRAKWTLQRSRTAMLYFLLLFFPSPHFSATVGIMQWGVTDVHSLLSLC